jgi:hypothetical protein
MYENLVQLLRVSTFFVSPSALLRSHWRREVSLDPRILTILMTPALNVYVLARIPHVMVIAVCSWQMCSQVEKIRFQLKIVGSSRPKRGFRGEEVDFKVVKRKIDILRQRHNKFEWPFRPLNFLFGLKAPLFSSFPWFPFLWVMSCFIRWML